MGEGETIKRALYDAIGWQESLADANRNDPAQFAECMAQAKRYRAILKRRYGTSRTPAERMFDGAKPVTLDELRSRNEKPAPTPEGGSSALSPAAEGGE